MATANHQKFRNSQYVNNSKRITAILVVLALFLMPLAGMPHRVLAASYEASLQAQSHKTINIDPGKSITFSLLYKNTGNRDWLSFGSNAIIAATSNQRGHNSVLAHESWLSDSQAGYMSKQFAGPQEMVQFNFALQAPSTPGVYTESFELVTKGGLWVVGSAATVTMKVGNVDTIQETSTSTTQNETEQTMTSPVVISDDYPVRDSDYAAEIVPVSNALMNVDAGERVLFKVSAKNIGKKSWFRDGTRFVSAYTVRPNYHDSRFATDEWFSSSQVKMDSESVSPGQLAQFVIPIVAPQTAGQYQETMRLAVEDYSWVSGSEFTFTVNVNNTETLREPQGAPEPEARDQKPETIVSFSDTVPYKDTSYKALVLADTNNPLVLNAGESTTYTVGFTNHGTKTWNNSGSRYVSLYTADPSYRNSVFATSAWQDDVQITMKESTVAPGEKGFFDISMKAPFTPGEYHEKFRLAVEDWTWIEGGELIIPINVLPKEGVTVDPSDELGPIMRVGLFDTTEDIILTANNSYDIRDSNGSLLKSASPGERATVKFNFSTKEYTVISGGFIHQSTDYVRFVGKGAEPVFTILSYEKRLPWNPSVNDNLFRDAIEIRYSNDTGKLWVINELPMEHYLRGISETSNSSPVEFLKVMAIVSRTYGMYHYERQTKHADEHFYVDSVYDQVYKGYGVESRLPKLQQAVAETAGMVVTYEDKIAITPFFSQSDGRTRDWSEVWGGEVEWLKSVPVPYDQGRELLGHGVGMSARGALMMVLEENKTFEEVIKYFFTGVDVTDRY